MLSHRNTTPKAPTRAVVLGAGGFVGKAAADRLQQDGMATVRLSRGDVDLLDDDADARLANRLKASDGVVVVSAEAPCKTNDMLVRNLRMMTEVCAALAKVRPAHVVYISSDAVYADSREPLTESSPAEPASLHGVMHLTREVMLKTCLGGELAILRPTLLYGADDPHNGYGPNQFRRLADENRDIVLFGEGEELRDHVLIDDLAEIIRLVLLHGSTGTLNVATGTVTSFRDIAEAVASHFDRAMAITATPRRGPMPHDGYRAFDIAACRKAFPGFAYVPLADGLEQTHRNMIRWRA